MRFFAIVSHVGAMVAAATAISGIARASITNVYIAQSALGTGDGSSCANARATSFFNISSNWGSGSAQIGPGTTVHVCGTIDGAAGGTGLTFQSSGPAG